MKGAHKQINSHGAAALWSAVLQQAISDAEKGPPFSRNSLSETRSAREWLRSGGRDLALVCTLAGIDPDAFRERIRPRIEALEPLPVMQVKPRRKRRTNKPGVGADFSPSDATGAPSVARDFSQMEFSE